MKNMKFVILWMLCLPVISIQAQQTYNLQSCLKYALENNHNLKKSQLDREKSEQARREVLGSLMPQINGTTGLNYNLKKPKFIMPNFINSMLPPNAQDPNAEKYMTIEMGTNYSASFGTTLNQQILNFSLFNAVDIARTAEKLATLGVESKEEDIITQTANLYYAIQSTNYAIAQFDSSFALIDKMIKTMEVSYSNGLIKKVDLDRLKVNKVNMASQKTAIENAAEVQKNLLKLQMGLDMKILIELEKINIAFFENLSTANNEFQFDLNTLIPYKLLQQQEGIVRLQRKAALYESLPALSLALNYQYNGVSDEFFRGETNYWYPSSAVGLNLRVPIFAGLSRSSKMRQADIEQLKIKEDGSTLEQSLNMAYMNTLNKLDYSKKTIQAQRENMDLAQEVYRISENNFNQGIAPVSDVLNGSSSLIQSQVS